MMTNFTPTFLSPLLDAIQEYPGTYNGTGLPNNTMHHRDPEPIYTLEFIMISIFSFLICLVGLVGNGTVIWLLSFHVKKNSFTTYILNLSVADFGVVAAVILKIIHQIVVELNDAFYYYMPLVSSFEALFFFMYNSGQLLLTAISVDRCVSVLFPIWHRCHRPPHLSTTVCALVWVLSFLLPGIQFTISLTCNYDAYFQFLVNVFFCFPLMTISALTLFIKLCFKSQQRQRKKLLTAILLALIFFLILGFPVNVILLMLTMIEHFYPMAYAYLCACLNSSVNPIFYFLLGRRKGRQFRESTKVIFQRIFKEEIECRKELESSTEI